MKKNLLKGMIVAIMAMVGIQAWGLTTTLTEDFELAGYKFVALHDFTTNDEGIMPTEGDLRFRSGYGLFDFGSGNRSASLNLSIAQGQLLVIDFRDTQTRNVTVNSITGCTKTDPQPNASYLYWDVNEDTATPTINIGRGGCVVAILVMEKDASAQTATYTVNYVDENGNTLKESETLTGVVGSDPTFSTGDIWVDGVKYVYDSNDAEGVTIASDGSTVVTLKFRLASLFTLTVVDNWGNEVGQSTVYEGETAAVPFCRYKVVDGTLYQKGANSNEYKTKVSNITEDKTVTITYEATDKTDVIFLVEGEDIEGLTACNGGTIDIRASNAKCGYNASEEEVATITSLSAGDYKITVHTVGNTDSSENWIMAGEQQIINAKFEGNFGIFTEDFTLVAESTLTIGKFGGSQKGIDLIYIQSANGIVTGIQSVNNAQTVSNTVYNLAGQKVMSAQKGLYIRDGKKFVVK